MNWISLTKQARRLILPLNGRLSPHSKKRVTKTEPQVGAAGYYIDIAVSRPGQSGKSICWPSSVMGPCITAPSQQEDRGPLASKCPGRTRLAFSIASGAPTGSVNPQAETSTSKAGYRGGEAEKAFRERTSVAHRRGHKSRIEETENFPVAGAAHNFVSDSHRPSR